MLNLGYVKMREKKQEADSLFVKLTGLLGWQPMEIQGKGEMGWVSAASSFHQDV